jgi:hypothetical protein
VSRQRRGKIEKRENRETKKNYKHDRGEADHSRDRQVEIIDGMSVTSHTSRHTSRIQGVLRMIITPRVSSVSRVSRLSR